MRAAVLVFGRMLALATVGVGLFGVLRLTRQFPAAASSPSLLVPFLLPVLALALEAGALVAFSASALGLFRLLPVRPIAPRLLGLLPVAGLLVLVLVLAEGVPRGTERPGAFANELIESARQSCGGAASVPVPLLGLNVRCDRGSLIEGPMPGVPSVRLTMQSLAFSDDLRQAQIRGLDLTAKRALAVRLRARDAKISGLAPWARSARFSAPLRCVLLLGIGLALGTAALFWPAAGAARDDDEKRRWPAVARAALAGLPGLAAAIVVIVLDQEQARPIAYAWAAGAGLLVVLLLWLAHARLPKIFNAFSGF
jgi:hypothetical protein